MADVAKQMLEKGLDPNLQNRQGLWAQWCFVHALTVEVLGGWGCSASTAVQYDQCLESGCPVSFLEWQSPPWAADTRWVSQEISCL
jgi:hypothetical protein